VNKVEPIMDRDKLDKMVDYLYNKSKRDYVMFEIGINLGMRVTDFTHQKVSFYREACEKGYIDLTPEKTKRLNKKVRIPISTEMNELITSYIKDMDNDDWMFPSRNKDSLGKPLPLTRYQIYNIINEAAQYANIKDNIGCHSMRKTFGYWHYYYNHDIRILMDIFNHSSEEVTLRYIGISDEQKRKSMENMSLGVRKL
jgi:integrase